MGKSSQSKEVPQWVRDFITQRQRQLYKERQHSEKDEKVQVDDNVYLLNPFSQDEVEAIRNGVWKLREEAFLATAKENRKLREAGHFVLDSGFSLKDDFFEMYLRPLLHTPLSRQEMQEAVIKHYGWGKWSEDPWGDFSRFCEWINSISDDERDVWAINGTFGGRVYFTLWILRHLSQYDYSKITEEDFLPWIGIGAENFLWVKGYTGWDDFEKHYPDESLPASFVNEQIIKVYLTCPFSGFRWFINSIYLWYFALKEFRERAKGHPELEAFLDYHSATDAHLAEICRKLAPKGYKPPDKNQSLIKLYQGLKGRLEAKERKYGDVLENGGASTLGSLLEGVTYWKSKAAQATIAGLKGQLGNSLLSIVKHDFIDATREKRTRKKHEVTESEIEATRVTDDDTPFLDTIPSQEPMPEEPIDLKRLGFDPDELTAGELRFLLDELNDAASMGVQRYSKEGLSLSQYWDKEHNPKLYERKMKMLKRLEAKRKKP